MSEIHCVPYFFTQIEFKQVPNKYGTLSSSKYRKCDRSSKQKLLTFAFNTCFSFATHNVFYFRYFYDINKKKQVTNFCAQKLRVHFLSADVCMIQNFMLESDNICALGIILNFHSILVKSFSVFFFFSSSLFSTFIICLFILYALGINIYSSFCVSL